MKEIEIYINRINESVHNGLDSNGVILNSLKVVQNAGYHDFNDLLKIRNSIVRTKVMAGLVDRILDSKMGNHDYICLDRIADLLMTYTKPNIVAKELIFYSKNSSKSHENNLDGIIGLLKDAHEKLEDKKDNNVFNVENIMVDGSKQRISNYLFKILDDVVNEIRCGEKLSQNLQNVIVDYFPEEFYFQFGTLMDIQKRDFQDVAISKTVPIVVQEDLFGTDADLIDDEDVLENLDDLIEKKYTETIMFIERINEDDSNFDLLETISHYAWINKDPEEILGVRNLNFQYNLFGSLLLHEPDLTLDVLDLIEENVDFGKRAKSIVRYFDLDISSYNLINTVGHLEIQLDNLCNRVGIWSYKDIGFYEDNSLYDEIYERAKNVLKMTVNGISRLDAISRENGLKFIRSYISNDEVIEYANCILVSYKNILQATFGNEIDLPGFLQTFSESTRKRFNEK